MRIVLSLLIGIWLGLLAFMIGYTTIGFDVFEIFELLKINDFIDLLNLSGQNFNKTFSS